MPKDLATENTFEHRERFFVKNFDFICYQIKGWDALNDKMHVHNDSYEVLQIVSGSGHFVIGGTPYPIIPGAVYFTNTVHLHCSRPDNADEYVRSKITINATYFDEVLRMLGLGGIAEKMFGIDGGSCVSLPPHAIAEVDKAFRRMSELVASKDPTANAQITMQLVHILLTCNNVSPKGGMERPNNNSLISRTVNYINANIASDLSIEVIAKDNFVSKYHLCRTFKKTLGVSIMKYILSQRLTLAKEQLIHTDASCSDIAMLIGFSSFSYFCRAFKQQEGMTPNKYRKLYGKK